MDKDFLTSYKNNLELHKSIYTGKNLINGITATGQKYTNKIYDASSMGRALGDNEIIMNYSVYNEIFGTDYTKKDLHKFTPHSAVLSSYRYTDCHCQSPLLEMQVTITALEDLSGKYGDSIFIVGDNISRAYRENCVFVSGLYFNGTKNMDAVSRTAERLSYSQNTSVTETLSTMTRTIDVFIPIFTLVAIILGLGVIFIISNFSSKMINGKLHEIGILKALGAKNASVCFIFGLQVALIALITCVLSGIGYYFFVDFANEMLVASLTETMPSYNIVNVDFLTFTPSVVISNCTMTAILSFASMLAPFLKIRNIKPVKIIKAKE